MRARFRGVLGFTVMMLMAGATHVHAEEINGPTPLHKSLFTSYAVLQALDVVSTVTALNSGNGREANPIVGGLAGHPAAFAAVKGAGAVSTLFFMHRYAKKHPKAAVITMIAFNAGYSYIVTRNLQIAAGR